MLLNKILVIGASHTGAFRQLLNDGFEIPGYIFDVYGINGAAFTNENLIKSSNNMLELSGVFAEGSHHNWFHSKETSIINLEEYCGVFLLEPLFIIAGLMRQQLWNNRKGICTEFLSGSEFFFPTFSLGKFIPITTHQWLEIYKNWRVGSIITMSTIRSINKNIPILILPTPLPPKRLDSAAYAYYNLKEQAFLALYLQNTFNIKFILQPKFTLNIDLTTFDEFHEREPDPHHPTPKYYAELLSKTIDFNSLDFYAEFKKGPL